MQRLSGMSTENFDKDKVIPILNRILEMELAGSVRYTHYSLMVYGYNRIPIVGWLREPEHDAEPGSLGQDLN